ncbi:CheR family methyltransferase [Granulosicoccus sp. 3-233]|uniref:CheR family methyltransferase n=1 Tax=Granulosicoccus sp. 3-233 TaxID=3417969 RepID=UPI003D336928
MDTKGSKLSETPLFVTIGCGDGGVPALQNLLSSLNAEATLALIVVSNAGRIDPVELADALNPNSRLKIITPSEGARVVEQGIYLLSPDSQLTVEEGRFRRHADPDGTDDDCLSPVDRLFSSLAMDQGHRTVGVILSGAGSDGTLGLKAISDRGGMTMVQCAETADVGSMPRSARDTGIADHVMSVEQIAQELIAYARHCQTLSAVAEPDTITDQIKAAIPSIARILQQHTGHNFQHYKPQTLTRRIQRHMNVLHLDDVSKYRSVLLSDAEQVHVLFRDLLIGVTAFFRDEDVFVTLVRKAFGNLLDGKGAGDTVRIWVAGCATGQEAYTLAMLICEYFDDVEDRPRVKIFASDIDEQALATARRGSYPEGIEKEVSTARLQRFFRKSGRRYIVNDRLREMCLFSTHNVIADPPFSRLDLISCRNLLIYLGVHLQEKLIPVFHYALKPGGYLLLGNSENLQAHKDLFTPVHDRHRLSRRREVNQALNSMPDPQSVRDLSVPSQPATPDLGTIAQRIIMDEFTPQWAIVNDDFQVLELSSDASRYLQMGAGTFQNNIIRLVRDSLQPGLRSTLRQARESREKIVHDRMLMRVKGGLSRVTLTVQPMPALGTDEELLMVIFQESEVPVTADRDPLQADNRGSMQHSQTMIARLEQELSTTQADLERTVQDLEAANEELKSSNEELLSINEELHSSNEELETSKEEIESSHHSLERANDDLENLLTSSRMATLFLDDNHCIRRFTPAICSIYNLIDSDIGRPIEHATHNARFMPALPRREDLGEDVDEIEVHTRDGRCFLRRVLPYVRTGNLPSGIVVTYTDITQSMAAEQFTRNVIDSLRSFVGVCSTDGVLLQANQTALTAAGVTSETVIGKPFRETPWWADKPESQDLLDAAIERAASGESSRFDVEINLRDGEVGIVDFQIEPMRAADGTVTHLIPSAIDVTHRRQMEVALELAELKSRSLLQEIEDIYNSAPIGLCVLDSELRWTRINQHLAEINGLSAAEHIGRSMAEVLPDIADQALPLLHEILETGKAIRNIPLSGTTPAQPGVERHWVESMIPVRDQDDKVVGISIVAEEVTHQRQSEERLKALKMQADEAREQAENANRFKSEFLANMSHEIRTPMTAILGYADLLESHLRDPDNLQSVRTIRRNGRFLINLINDILDLSKIESGKLELELVPVSPVEIIEQTLDMMQLQADRKQLELGVEYLSKLPVTLETDPTRLRQILVNLTGNAVKFTETGGVTLRIDYQAEPEPCVLFHVTDTGIGMTESQQTEVFAAFRQADSSISRRFGGSGLGLAISQRLAASLGGSIRIKSQPGEGSTLTLTLPAGDLEDIVLETPVKRQVVETAESLQVPDLPYRLLAVDDRRDVLHVVQHILEDAGAQVSTASGAADAFRKVAQAESKGNGFEAIVLDMQMPEINGYDAAATLRKQGFKAPIVALTANAMKGEREKCLQAGCTDYLTKPIDKHLLIESLHRQIGEGRAVEEAAAATRCILLVEDHEESARIMKRLLERSGHTVHMAHTAAQAVSSLDSIRPDVILSDIGLPDEDGYSLVSRLRRMPTLEKTRFVALTGSSELDEDFRDLFDHHMTKPVEIDGLRAYLQQT